MGSEDCLYLNVYRPKGQSQQASSLLPVLVFIHGGSFQGGSTDPAIYGPEFFMAGRQIILVTIQYRLGVFGFLAAGHRSCKGNFGLKDQNLALHWIYENIGAFGGDSQAVTLMGQSSGAASVQYQMISHRSNGLFQRAVLLSGSALAFWAIDRNPDQLFRRYAAVAGILNADSQHPSVIVKQLKQKTSRELLEYQRSVPVFHAVMPLFRPVVEGDWGGAFIQEDPMCIWQSGEYEQRPFLTGVTGYEEGSFDDLYYNRTTRNYLINNWEISMSAAMDLPIEVLGPIKEYYFDGEVTERNSINVLRVRDRLWDYPMFETVEQYSRYGNLRQRPVHLYRFNFTSLISWSQFTNPHPIEGRGASHADDLLYLFRTRLFDAAFANRNSPESAMRDFFVKFIGDYVKTGRSRLNEHVRSCNRRRMEEGICEYLDIQRDFSVTPNRVQVAASDEFDLEMVKVYKRVDEMIAELQGNRCNR